MKNINIWMIFLPRLEKEGELIRMTLNKLKKKKDKSRYLEGTPVKPLEK
jgi:hypothetical protein